jgi:hypothetical protein
MLHSLRRYVLNIVTNIRQKENEEEKTEEDAKEKKVYQRLGFGAGRNNLAAIDVTSRRGTNR